MDSIQYLPQEVVLHIFHHLNASSLIQASLVCQQWHHLIESNDTLWKYPTLSLIRQSASSGQDEDMDIPCSWKSAFKEAKMWLVNLPNCIASHVTMTEMDSTSTLEDTEQEDEMELDSINDSMQDIFIIQNDKQVDMQEEQVEIYSEPMPFHPRRTFIESLPFHASTDPGPPHFLIDSNLIIVDGKIIKHVQLQSDGHQQARRMIKEKDCNYETKWIETTSKGYSLHSSSQSTRRRMSHSSASSSHSNIVALNECCQAWTGGYSSFWRNGQLMGRVKVMPETHQGELNGNLYLCSLGWWIAQPQDPLSSQQQHLLRLWKLTSGNDDCSDFQPHIVWETYAVGVIKGIALSGNQFCATVVEHPILQELVLEVRSMATGDVLGCLFDRDLNFEMDGSCYKIYFTPLFMIVQLAHDLVIVDLTRKWNTTSSDAYDSCTKLTILARISLHSLLDIEPFHVIIHENRPILCLSTHQHRDTLTLVDFYKNKMMRHVVDGEIAQVFDFGTWIVYSDYDDVDNNDNVDNNDDVQVMWRGCSIEEPDEGIAV